MIAKIVKGSNFGGVVKYILDPKKQTELLDSDGVRTKSIEHIAQSFEAQQQLNSQISKPVGHISLDFSAQNRAKLTNEVMTQIAHNYMSRMDIVNTQYIIGRHHDKDHPHLHIVYNRVDNNGKTISDKNDRIRSVKICKELTIKYGLYFAKGKEHVKEHRLKEPDKTKYEIYNALKKSVQKCRSWQELIAELKAKDITVEFKMKSGTNEPQGIKFTKNSYHFNGSKVDREFSFSKIDFQLKQNNQPAIRQDYKQVGELANKQVNQLTDQLETIGLFDFTSNNPAIDPEEEAFRRRMQHKKKKGIRR